VRNEEVLQRVKTDMNILQTIKRRSANWIGRMLCGNCFLQHGIRVKVEGIIEVIGRRARQCKHLLYYLKKQIEGNED
jgi:arginyl-tRNA--protein-N-Asp/Glu arginylyltransferase